MKYIFTIGIIFHFLLSSYGQTENQFQLKAEEYSQIPDKLGLAGSFSGLIGEKNNMLLVAGGANFAPPVWESTKAYYDRIYVGRLGKSGIEWFDVEETLPRVIGYGSSVSVDGGLICMGGHNSEQVYDEVFLLQWIEHEKRIKIVSLPSLPQPATHGGSALIGNYIYYACGQSGLGLESATKNLWRLDISDLSDFSGRSWEVLPALPGPSRAVHIVASQYNGRNEALYVISGRRIKDHYQGSEPYEFLKDVWEFDPSKLEGQEDPWSTKSDAPVRLMGAPTAAYGQSHIFVLGGADGSLIYQNDSLRDLHPGFPKKAWAYHTITDSWIPLGDIPLNLVTGNAVVWGDDILVPSGEMRPRVRSPKIFKYSLEQAPFSFGWLNYLTLIIYLIAMLLVGVYFTRRNKNTNDFFRGGQRIPWWAAACSIFATMLSSLTYMSVPAKAYMTNWEYLMGYPAILLTSILVIYLILPFFRKIDATSAYEYLEKRFNKGSRYLGSGFFILFQIGRMAIVMFLSALALSAITPFTAVHCILIMGVLSIIYSTLGGVVAVIWTDNIQTCVLLGGAILIFTLVILKLDGGFNEFVQVGNINQKFKTINWDWDMVSYTTAAFWVIVVGSLGQNLVSYGSDQAIIQRYMTTSDSKKSAKSILANGLIALPAGLLFFAVGTALFVFYKSHPNQINPDFKNDAIMPMFIIQEIPAGLAGLIIAGIFAAAQSTISTSMNSIASAAITDFAKPLGRERPEKQWLQAARYFTVIFGFAGIGLALIFASADIKSLLDQFFAILGLFGGALGGMFMLGMFTKRANGTGAIAGAAIGAITLYFISNYTETHVYLYAAIGIVSTMISGWIISLFAREQKKNIEGLTIYDIYKKRH